MNNKITVKICGLNTAEAVKAAENGGAEFLGFIFHPPSPRYITPADAGIISRNAKAKKVAVVVDAANELLEDIIRNLNPDYIQLHGNETDKRAEEIKQTFYIPLIKAIHNYQPSTINHQLYDYLLFDSAGGGTGKQFDYTNFTPPQNIEWFLSGGLNAENVLAAIKQTGAKMVDVSSGVESTRGVKDANKIAAFLKKVSY